MIRTTFLLVLLMAATIACSSETPKPIQTLLDQGLTISREFDAEAGMKGYVVDTGGQQMILYLTPDKRHLVHGNLIDENGMSLTARHMERYAPGPSFNDAWEALGQATWIRDGSETAERVVYVFSDPNCPYCHQFWEAARPYVGDNVQLRHIMVGILRPSSIGKAARLLAADDPEAALREHEENYDNGGAAPLESIPADIERALQENRQLMASVGSQATPTILFKDRNGEVRRLMGLPRTDEMLKRIFGVAD